MSDITWVPILKKAIPLEVQTQVTPTKGNLVYEYNPFRNYRLTQNMYEYKGNLYTLDELHKQFGLSLYNNTQWIDRKNQISGESPVLRESGELVDFITGTDELSFDINHPVSIIPQHSYDGSVNLILNDGVNPPKLINSRFSATGRNTYEIVDRKGNNDTNIYDQGGQFKIDSSLYKSVVRIPKLQFKGCTSGGNLKVGNYFFYFKLADADGNETDFIAESGLVSVFIGFDYPDSVTTGQKNENSFKNVSFFMSNIDVAYDHVRVYYSRTTAEGSENANPEYKEIDRKYIINNAGNCNILITGHENTIPITASDINLNYNIVDAANAQASCQNRLFLGNVHKPNIPYEELADLSLRFLPYLKEEPYPLIMDENYSISSTEKGYYDEKYIYDKTGYWEGELYRLGIVYIMPTGELSPVFNIRGGIDIKEFKSQTITSSEGALPFLDGQYKYFPVYKDGRRNKIIYNEDNNYIIDDGTDIYTNDVKVLPSVYHENVKGVIRFKSDSDTNTVHGLDIRVDNDTINELKKYVKGYFFVRQKRIPTIIAQGITIGIDKESHCPTIPTAGGILDKLADSLEKTHVETSDIKGVNYISEGFLSRYQFKFSKKKSSVWKKIGTAVAITAAVAALAVATYVTGGVALAAAGIVATAVSGSTVATIAIAGAATTAAVATGMAKVGLIQEAHYAINRIGAKSLNGRNTKVPSGYKLTETDNSRQLNGDFSDRIIIKDPDANKVQAILCPDYEVNQPYYNQIFTGNEHLIQLTNSQCINGDSGLGYNYFSNDGRHFYIPEYHDKEAHNAYTFKVLAVGDDLPIVGMNDYKFRSRAGNAEEAWRYECVGEDYKSDYSKAYDDEDDETISNKKINGDIIRGSFGPYLAFDDPDNKFSPAETVNIFIPHYSPANLDSYINTRMHDDSIYYTISERYDINDMDDQLVTKRTYIRDQVYIEGYYYNLFRGDCYICQFTHRLNRNFNSPSAPYNDEIVDENTWKDHYNPDKPEEYSEINLGDVNAVQLGMWVTFRVRSSNNLNIRTLDHSQVDEEAMTGHPRGYYPYLPMNTEGPYKKPDSQVFNNGFNFKLNERYHFLVPDVPYIKNWFGTRIMYSDIHLNDAYQNGFRTFRGQNYRDYTREYGEIVKLVSLNSNLLCVFEHGIALIAINERTLAGSGAGGAVYINTNNVLPENPKIISNSYGSQWADSVLKVPTVAGRRDSYVYGVDTVAKKIWRTDGTSIECISDFKVQQFLNENITLGERELTPIIGIRNVKTFYNAYKHDVMFTFYDNTYGFEEKVWNLCWNELMNGGQGQFVTFYSWVPSVMENINNIPFSFDRNVSKWIAKLGTTHNESSFADGITLSNVLINNYFPDDDSQETEQSAVVDDFSFDINILLENGQIHTKTLSLVDSDENFTITQEQVCNGYIGVLGIKNRVLPDTTMFYQLSYHLERDPWNNYKLFDIKEIGTYTIPDNMGDDSTKTKYAGQTMHIYGLYFNNKANPKDLMSELYYRNKAHHTYADSEENKMLTEEVKNLPIFKNLQGKRPMLPKEQRINEDRIVAQLMIRADIEIDDTINGQSASNAYYNQKANLINAGYYESTIAVTTKWNMQFLTSDFWKHGQAGLIDVADDIYPTNWYGKQHPFEFECIVVNDPSVHKIFTNLELIANKAKPESFHYEVIGEAYDFAKDKANMYFRQEAIKALWQYNGADITYNRNFLTLEPKQNAKSADLVRTYYARTQSVNEIESYYRQATNASYNYDHLSGGEIVYYPNRQEFRIWNHVKAVDIDDQKDTSTTSFGGRGLIASNMRYLEDRWKVTINPLLVVYRNEYKNGLQDSTWAYSYDTIRRLPPLPIYNSPIPDVVKDGRNLQVPGITDDSEYAKSNALYHLYTSQKWAMFDSYNWLDAAATYGINFGTSQNRRETDIRDKFLKVRIRYSGEELAVIDWLNTVYQISYA